MTDNNSFGLVLSGGGAKGAFEVGAWKAIRELGLAENVKVISGTSIGAINGAFIACNLKKNEASGLEKIWESNEIEENIQWNIPNKEAIWNAFKNLTDEKKNYPLPEFLKAESVEKFLKKKLPSWPQDAIQLYVTTLLRSENSYDKIIFDLSTPPRQRNRIKKIMASAAFPCGFNVEISGKKYSDGGFEAKGGDNFPVRPILENHKEIKTIIAISCSPIDEEIKRDYSFEAEDVKIIYICPEDILPGRLDAFITKKRSKDVRNFSGTISFKKEYISEYIEQGYKCASQILRRELKKR